ncbi:MAG: selenocysteine-specific translation elongation factor [Lachnospiraceae bacterium]|nr:selenocysteine-specific translation elongation factor [Lachnospiraceae bacterium]
MEHFIIGTAGHVDHGKTALIKAITGHDTDLIPEEKKRGISIDLGFTFFTLPDGRKAGVIDVPGHEKFLSNMLSGVYGMDLVLLVIAADEGIMPQTVEHIEILELLKIEQGIIVITKCDLVEEGWPELLAEDIRAELQDTVCRDWPCICVSSVTGSGIKELMDHIGKMSSSLRRIRSTEGRFRLPIDRVLSPKGIGTVVAGTLLEGSIYLDDDIMLYPPGQMARIRSMQVHGEDKHVAHAGQRVALSLSGIEKEKVKRGDVIACPGSLIPADRMDVRLVVGRYSTRSVKNQSRVHVYIGTKETIARVILLDKDELAPGESGYAQLVLQENIVAKRGDNLVIRYYSPLETIGGGTVISPNSEKHKRFHEPTITLLSDKENNETKALVFSVISGSCSCPTSRSTITEKTGLTGEEAEAVLDQDTIILNGKKKSYYWLWDHEKEFRHCFLEVLLEYFRENPYSLGFTKLMAKTAFLKSWDNEAVDAYVRYLLNEGIIKDRQFGTETFFYPAAVTLVQRKEEEGLRKEIEKIIEEGRFNLGDLSSVNHPTLSDSQYEDYLKYMVYSGVLVNIKDKLYTTPLIADEIIAMVKEYFKTEEILSFASLRDLLGTSRKTAKPLMAWLDDRKITAWCGKETERKPSGF